MSNQQAKQQIITFKADDSIVSAMEGITNRSEFIRAAILAALDGVCPLCRGSGVLNPKQRQHWLEFNQTHAVEMCGHCHELRFVCNAGSAT